MNTDNSYLFKILNLPEDGSIVIDKVEQVDNIKYIYLSKPPIVMYCSDCFCRMHSKGIYKRKVKHPILQDSTNIILIISQRKWKCTSCGAYHNEEYPFLEPYKQSTTITPLLVLNAMKDLNRSTSSIAKQFYLSDTQVHDLFTAYIDLPRLPLPEYLSVDEVHINISEKEKYALVLMDFVSGEIVDILHNRWHSTASNYFLSIPIEERRNVKCIISDAYSEYLEYSKSYFPNAINILDSFHVTKYLISLLNNYIHKVQKRYQDKDKIALEQKNLETNQDKKSIKDSKEVRLLKKYRWVLLKNQQDINYSSKPYYNSSLGMYVDTYAIETLFLALDHNFLELRTLKEKYISFNNSKFDSKDAVVLELTNLINEFKASNQYIFRQFSDYLSKYQNEIVLSFITTEVSRKSKKDQDNYYARLSNGPMESFNRKPKDLKRNSRGFSNFNYTRNRILWATRSNPAFLATPKTSDVVHSFIGKKRGKYSK